MPSAAPPAILPGEDPGRVLADGLSLPEPPPVPVVPGVRPTVLPPEVVPSGVPPWVSVVVVIGILAALIGLIVYGMYRTSGHAAAIQQVSTDYATWAKVNGGYRPEIALGFASYSANYEAAMFTKCVALLMAYVLVIVGCLFVVQGYRVFYELTIEHTQIKSALQTSSPGLVLITLGCALVAVAIFVQKDLSIAVDNATGNSPPSQAVGGTAQTPSLSSQAPAPPAEVAGKKP